LFLALLYLLAAIGAFPILYYLFVYYIIGFTIDTPDRFATARVGLSGPLLILAGIAITSISFTSLYKNRKHRFFGIMIFWGGVAWIVMLVYEVLTK